MGCCCSSSAKPDAPDATTNSITLTVGEPTDEAQPLPLVPEAAEVAATALAAAKATEEEAAAETEASQSSEEEPEASVAADQEEMRIEAKAKAATSSSTLPTTNPIPFDPQKLKLDHESGCEYDPDPMERQTDYYADTTLTYEGRQIFSKSSVGAENIGGLDGHTHTAALSEDKRTLTIVVSALIKGGRNMEVEACTYQVADLIEGREIPLNRPDLVAAARHRAAIREEEEAATKALARRPITRLEQALSALDRERAACAGVASGEVYAAYEADRQSLTHALRLLQDEKSLGEGLAATAHELTSKYLRQP